MARTRSGGAWGARGAWGRAEARERPAGKRDRTLGGNESREGTRQGRLAGAVGADQRDQLARGRRKTRVAHDLGRADARGDVAGDERAHDTATSSRRLSRKIIDRKIGTPISAVTTPSLISTAEGPPRSGMAAARTNA